MLIAFYLVPYTCKERDKTRQNRSKCFHTVLWMSVKIAMGAIVLVGVPSLWLALAGCCKDVSVVCVMVTCGGKEEVVTPADGWPQ